MLFHNATRVMLVLWATAALAQSTFPGTTPAAPTLNVQSPNLPGPAARRGSVGNRTLDPQSAAAMRERVQDMEKTLSEMHAALKQMHAKAARSKVTDPQTKANLDMWELMVGHLDKELEQLRTVLAQREDLEVRRAALYKQADAKGAAEAAKFRAAQAARFAQAGQNAGGTAAPTPISQSAEQNHPAATAPSVAAPTDNSASPK